MEIKTMTNAYHDLAKGWAEGGMGHVFIRVRLRVKDSTITLLLGPCLVILF